MVERYTGKLNGETCAVCHFTLKENQSIYRCCSCSALFHEAHLNEWLKKSDFCPICQSSLREKSEGIRKQTQTNISLTKDEIEIKNYMLENKKDFIIIRIILLAFSGTVFGLLGYFLSLIEPGIIWYQIVLLIGALIPMSASGIIMLYMAFEIPKWSKLIFQKDQIIIEKPITKKNLTLTVDEIITIELEHIMKTPADKKQTSLMTNIELNIFTEEKKHQIGRIYFSKDEGEGLEYYNKLTNFMNKYYHISPKTEITRNKKHTLLQNILGLLVFIIFPIISLILYFTFYEVFNKL